MDSSVSAVTKQNIRDTLSKLDALSKNSSLASNTRLHDKLLHLNGVAALLQELFAWEKIWRQFSQLKEDGDGALLDKMSRSHLTHEQTLRDIVWTCTLCEYQSLEKAFAQTMPMPMLLAVMTPAVLSA